MNKFGSVDHMEALSLDLKFEVDIKDEPFDSIDENDWNIDSLRLQEQALEKCTKDLSLVNHGGGESMRIEVNHEDPDALHEEGVEGNGCGMKTQLYDYILDDGYEVKMEVHKDVAGSNHIMKNDSNIPNNDFSIDEDILYRQSEEQGVPNVDIQKSDIENRKKNFVDMEKGFTEKQGRSLVSESSSRFGNVNHLHDLKNEREGDNIKDIGSEQGIKVKKIFKCSLCAFTTHLKNSLKRHSLTHSNTKLFKCSECDYECIQKCHLQRHLLIHSNGKFFSCYECGYKCNYKGSLKRHLLIHSSTMVFKCSECDYECNRKVNLMMHLLTHASTKLFKCAKCDYECNYKGHLKRHLFTHSDTKMFKCSECDYECKQKDSLKIHSLTHSNAKLFKCSECDYECNYKSSLKSHLLTHSAKKLFKCFECDYECIQKGNLKRHLLTHSNTKLFKCAECDYKCNQKVNLKKHLLTHSRRGPLLNQA